MKTLHVSIYCNIHITALSNVRENRRGNQEWTIQRHWQHWVYKTPNIRHRTQDTERRQTKQKTQHRKLKRRVTRIPPKTWDETRGSRRASRSCFL
jgi:hypothetical protein